MAKLHELLAVEGDLKSGFEKACAGLVNDFTKKDAQFRGQVRTYDPSDEEGERLPAEEQHMISTVQEKISQAKPQIARYLDAVLQKESTNTRAYNRPDVDGIFGDLPATALLALEGRLKQVHALVKSIPTLDSTDQWNWDADQRRWAARPSEKTRTMKIPRNHVRAEATKEHPAQVDVFTEDVVRGTWTTRKFSGMVSPAQKSDLLDRVERLQREVKKARQRANTEEVVENGLMGEKILDWIFEPIK